MYLNLKKNQDWKSIEIKESAKVRERGFHKKLGISSMVWCSPVFMDCKYTHTKY